MAQAPMSDEKIRETLHFLNMAGGNRTQAAKLAGLNPSTFGHRLRLAKAAGLEVAEPPSTSPLYNSAIPGRLQTHCRDGVVLIGSDAHFWPDIVTTAFRAFVHFCKEMHPKIVIMNGDMLDGASISRHPPINWASQPSLIQEIETVQDRLGEIAKAAEGAERYWPAGNHDLRLEMKLAAVAPEFAKVKGTQLHDHFPDWQPCWSVWVNDELVVKHRLKSGVHAPHNNTMWSGKSIVTGHLHSLKVQPITDYDGTRFGIDCGTMADIYGPQFDYAEDGPRSWRSGFVVLTFVDGKMLWPEICHVLDAEHVDFRGKIIKV